MTKEQIFEKISDVISDVADIDKSEIQLESKIIYDIGLCSIEILNVIATIENIFSITISENSLRSFITVQDIVDYVSIAIEKRD